METKKVIKRLLAVGAGSLMLGATAMGALAADLKDYPAFFVKDGSYNGYLVVGEKAAAVDNLAMTDIAAGMKYLKAAEVKTTATVSGDAWMVGTSAKKL
ncbi:MAG: S-layer protein, partial [Nanoarchaeota archaeon]